MKYRTFLSNTILNSIGWRTKRKFVVFESDDWGSIRMPSKDVYNSLLRKNVIQDSYVFAKFDSLASETDLESLFEILSSYKDRWGKHPVFTANSVVANPDFQKIQEINYQAYFYEPFIKTLERYPNHKNSFNLWKEGQRHGVFHPQFHGREHINIRRWLLNLQGPEVAYREAFQQNTFVVNIYPFKKCHYIAAALDVDSEDDYVGINKIIEEGYKLFNQIFGYGSLSFIAPNFIWSDNVEDKLKQLGVKFIQTSRKQNRPMLKSKKYQKVFRYTGQKNRNNQIYLTRNCYFEPSLSKNPDIVNACLKAISNAFFLGKPAIICTHRLNYIGSIDRKNTDKNLPLLSSFIKEMLLKWPDIEFVTSDQLGLIIQNDK